MALHDFCYLSLLIMLIQYLTWYSNLVDQPTSRPHDTSLNGECVYPLYCGDKSASAYDPHRFGASNDSTMVNSVDDYGAKGDGSDDGEAFGKAWDAACSSLTPAVLNVPSGKSYLLKPITFLGPCMSNVSLVIMGTIEASSNQSDWDEDDSSHWIHFNGVNNLTVGGGGTVDGKGTIWWQNSCKINESLPCKGAPTAITFYSCNNLKVDNLKIKDSQQIHLSFEKSNNVKASRLTITAPVTSPNTDGIHVAQTINIQISNCIIETGDDCISIVTGSQNVQARNIVCGPSHGISIGSLGSGNSEAQVSGVNVDTAEFHGSANGVRIKTWQGGSGYATNIVFQNIVMYDVQNPIIIDQNYCDTNEPCKEQKSAVEVSDVTYKNITGTSASEVAIKFDCSASVPCSGIILEGINLVRDGNQDAKSSCKSVKFNQLRTVVPPPCA